MSRLRAGALVLSAAGLLALAYRVRRVATGRRAPGGVLMADVPGYDALSRLYAESLFRPIAADVTSIAPPGALFAKLDAARATSLSGSPESEASR